MDKIESIYRKYNRPAAHKLLQLARSEGLQVTSNEIKEFLSGRVKEQHLKGPSRQNIVKGILFH